MILITNKYKNIFIYLCLFSLNTYNQSCFGNSAMEELIRYWIVIVCNLIVTQSMWQNVVINQFIVKNELGNMHMYDFTANNFSCQHLMFHFYDVSKFIQSILTIKCNSPLWTLRVVLSHIWLELQQLLHQLLLL